jgi:hypothetical protein
VHQVSGCFCVARYRVLVFYLQKVFRTRCRRRFRCCVLSARLALDAALRSRSRPASTSAMAALSALCLGAPSVLASSRPTGSDTATDIVNAAATALWPLGRPLSCHVSTLRARLPPLTNGHVPPRLRVLCDASLVATWRTATRPTTRSFGSFGRPVP